MLNVIFFFSFFSCILLFKVSKDDITVKIVVSVMWPVPGSCTAPTQKMSTTSHQYGLRTTNTPTQSQ